MEIRRTTLTPDLFEPTEVQLRESEKIAGPSVGFWKDAWRRLRKNRGAIASLVVLLTLFLMAFVIGPLLSEYTPYAQNLADRFQGPSAEHWLGTDAFGRDMWTRIWEGAQVSLYIAFLAAAMDLVIGVAFGMISGVFGGRVDDIMQRIIEVLVGIPNIIVVILVVAALGSSVVTIAFALVITGWVNMARIVRGRVMQLREQEYFLASRSLGASRLRLAAKHLIPNSLGPIIITLMLTIPSAIFAEAILSFIGLGIQPPEASLGLLTYEGASQIRFYPYLLWFPAAVISLLMISFNLLGDGLNDALDPKQRK